MRRAARLLLAATFAAPLLAGAAGPATAQQGSRATGGYLYVPNQADATISVVDAGTREVVETVDLRELGFPPDAKPHDVAAAPDGSAWYVSLIGANTVLAFDADDELVGRAAFDVPGMLAVSPDGGTVWVARSMSAVDPPERLGRIDTSEMEVEEIEVLFPRPHALAVGPGGEHAHTASLGVNRMATVAAGSGRVSIVDVEGPTHTFVQFAVSPDGETLVATGQVSGRLLVFDRTDPTEPTRKATLEVGAEPWHPVFTPDGRHVVFGNKEDDSVTIVDARSWEVAAVVRHPALSQPHGAVAGPEGRHVYVSNNNLDGAWRPEGWSAPGAEDGEEGASPPGSVAVIDVECRSVVDVIPVGRDPNGLGFRPRR